MSIPYPSSLVGVGGARTGIAPVNLLDVQDVNGNLYFWADRKTQQPNVIPNADGGSDVITSYLPWILSVPSFTFHRSLVTDVGKFVLQNISGDTLNRDFEALAAATAFEGALFVWRLWQPDAQAAWLEVHGTLTLSDNGDDTVTADGAPLINPSEDDTPLEVYCETCQLDWAQARCGSTEATECSYSFQSCQVVERIMVSINTYETNFGETLANTAQTPVNRARRF